MPSRFMFASRRSDLIVTYKDPEFVYGPQGQQVVTKPAEYITFQKGVYTTTNPSEAEFLRKRMKQPDAPEMWEIGAHADAPAPHEILAQVMVLDLENEDDLATARDIYRDEVDGPKRDEVMVPMKALFKKAGVSENKPGRPKANV